MNLLNMLTKILTSGASLQALAGKTGLSEKQLKMIIAVALPLLLRKLTSNASSQSGAQSLLGALGQHRNTGAIETQLAEADEEDGAKIVGHILGEEQDDVIASVARETGASSEDVSRVLGNISPSLLSGLSAATDAASSQQSGGVDLSDGFDMTDVLGLLGGGAGGGNSAGSLLGSLFGGGGAGAAGGGAGLLGSLLGGGARPEEDQSINGTELLGSLLSMMK